MRRSLVFVAVGAIAVTGAVVTPSYLNGQGRVPPSDFVTNALGRRNVVFDRTYRLGGSTEDRARVLLIAAPRSPQQVLDTLLAKGGWRRLGDGIERRSDGLCVLAYTANEYQATHTSSDATEAADDHPNAVVVTLLYC